MIATANATLEDYGEDGVTGRMVPAGDQEALAGTIADVLDDPGLAGATGPAGAQQSRPEGHTSAGVVERSDRGPT